MKQKNKRNLLIVSVLLLALCFVTGCGLFKSDTEQLKDLLEDKYGEKFEIKSYYYDGDMWAMCYPVNDPTLLFQVRTDEHAERIKHDYYLQNVVARQVEEEYGPLVEQAFPGSYLSVDISHTLSSIPENFPKADTVTLDDIMQYYSENDISSDIVLNIFVDTSQMSEDNIALEYKFIDESVGSRVANGEFPNTIIKIYFGDANYVRECKKIIEDTTWMQSDIYEKIKNQPFFKIFFYEDGIPELSGGQGILTLEKYIEKRTEALNNG